MNQTKEIESAIKAVQGLPEENTGQSSIRLLPTMPTYRYRYTCPRCGSHGTSLPLSSVRPSSKVCAVCHILETKQDREDAIFLRLVRNGVHYDFPLRDRPGLA